MQCVVKSLLTWWQNSRISWSICTIWLHTKSSQEFPNVEILTERVFHLHKRLPAHRTGPRHVDTPGRLIWRPFKPIFFKCLFNAIFPVYSISVLYRLASRAAARLDSPLIRPWLECNKQSQQTLSFSTSLRNTTSFFAHVIL